MTRTLITVERLKGTLLVRSWKPVGPPTKGLFKAKASPKLLVQNGQLYSRIFHPKA